MLGSEPLQCQPTTPVLRHVVGLGASAGGLTPLIEVLQGFPAGAGLAFIVVEHLSPDQPSALAALMQAHTPMQVIEAVDGQRIEPDRVYVIMPATSLTVVQRVLRVQPVAGHSAHPIDDLLVSLAQDFGPRAVGVVLSGLGSDGSAGLRAIVDRGGIALAQTPETAQFDAMPRSAAAIGPAVMVCPPSQMPQRLLAAAAATQPPAEGPVGADLTAAQSLAQSLALVLRQVAAFTGHDFSQYKTSTLERRIGRRMAVYGCASLADYWRLLSANPQEAELLVKEMLIGVTSFFRDPAMWASAQQLTLPVLFDLAVRRPDPKLRAWVVGCSTGEEAYTVAMLLFESRDSNPAWRSVALQIFATDLSADAIQIARRGVYPAAIAQSLSADRLSRFFVPEHEGYRVTKALRESVLFVPHNLISDAPFSQIDLLTCRNLLIYFKSGLQQRILTLFHYVLRTGGCLLLGRAETIGRQAPLFPPIDVKLRIFGRGLHPRAAAAAVFPVKAFLMTPSIPQDAAPPAVPLQKLADRLMLDEFVPPAVLVSEEGDILYISGRTGRFLEPAAGKANWNIHAMARNGLRAPLSTALRQVSSQGQALELRGLNVEHGGAGGRVDLLVRPVNLGAYGRLVLILFRAATAVPEPVPVGAPQALDGHDSELARSQDQTRALGEEMQSSQEELQSAVEELQATNEELQSANEELTTSKEEMQAMYEELQTVNAELLSKLEDLAVAQGDLNNLLDSTQIATLFLDRAMNVRRFTEQAKQVFSLRDVDIGRPLSDLRSSLEDTMLLDDIAEVLRTLVPCEKEVKADGGRLYLVRAMPYRTLGNVVDGAVITFADITAAKPFEGPLRGRDGS